MPNGAKFCRIQLTDNLSTKRRNSDDLFTNRPPAAAQSVSDRFGCLYDYRNNEGCARYQHWENTSKEYLREWIGRYAQSAFLSKEPEQHYAICRATGAADGQLIGDLSYFYNGDDPCITLGYTISYRHWRQGYAFEMLSTLLPAIQKAYPQTDIVALVEKENVPSIALLQNAALWRRGFPRKSIPASL